jgi:hypothetical protein
MATTTTNFGWDIPQSTDLVKDGATAIAALGQDIDTAFVDFKGGTTGQVLKKTSGTDLDVEWGTASSGLTLINTTSFSAVASHSVNDVFSATYDNYRILFATSATTLTGDIQFRFRVSGADNTTSNYGSVSFIANNGTTRTQQADQNVAILLSSGTTSSHKGISMDVMDPFSSTKKTKFQGTTSGIGAGVTDCQSGFTGGGFNANTSFTGFSFIVGNGTMTGTVSVFGYNL